jgi:signal transduction histidine kinase/ActR/RegA family two-component response regulator
MLITTDSPRASVRARDTNGTPDIADPGRLLALLRIVTRAADTARGADSALAVAVDAIRASTGAALGLLYVPVNGRLGRVEVTGPAGPPPGRLASFLSALAVPGQAAGSPAARALASGRPAWMPDLATAVDFPASAVAGAVGLHTGFALPVVTGGTVVAVLEFFTRRPIPRHELFVEALAQVGTLLGGVVQRARADAALREDRRRLETAVAELQRTQEQFVQQQRLQALRQMASGIAHDFNNVLVPIAGFSDLLVSHPQTLDDRAKTGRYLGLIRTAADEAVKLVHRLREFYRSRDDTDWYEAVDLNELVTRAIAATEPRWREQARARGLDIRVETALGDIPSVTGGASQLQELIANLLVNAVDAMPTGGTVTVRTGLVAGDPGNAAARVRLAVEDTGTGMTEEVRQRCLEPFFTTKGERGTGLGLAVTLGIVKRHEGTIDVRSAPGKGTQVVVDLPVGLATDAGGLLTTGGGGRSFHVLIVDDEPFVRDILREFFTLEGHTVHLAEDGRAGLAAFRAQRFDAVLTDRGMPELNGDQLAAAIKAESPETPVIMLTGHGDTMRAVGDRPAGIDLVLSKPATLATIREALSKIEDCLTLATVCRPTGKADRALALLAGPRPGAADG